MQTVITVEAVRAQVRAWRAAGQRIALVPTMGNLHAGHMSLLAAARARAERVVASVFVNPLQFGPAEDFKSYPRTLADDEQLLREAQCDLLFAPGVEEIYPDGGAQPTVVTVRNLAGMLCGQFRPGHFDGVATVVAKLFGMTMADRAYFGEKDWQQLQIVQRMALDLNIPVEVIGCPTIREADGLARSSRNVRLSPEARTKAAALPRAMTRAARAIRQDAPVSDALAKARAEVLAAGFEQVEYMDLCDAATLLWIDEAQGPARLLAAAWIGGVRLIAGVQPPQSLPDVPGPYR